MYTEEENGEVTGGAHGVWANIAPAILAGDDAWALKIDALYAMYESTRHIRSSAERGGGMFTGKIRKIWKDD